MRFQCDIVLHLPRMFGVYVSILRSRDDVRDFFLKHRCGSECTPLRYRIHIDPVLYARTLSEGSDGNDIIYRIVPRGRHVRHSWIHLLWRDARCLQSCGNGVRFHRDRDDKQACASTSIG